MGTVYTRYSYTCGSCHRPYRIQQTRHTHHATTHGTRPADATAALHEPSTVRTALSARPRASARPPSQSQAQARKGRRADGCTLGRQLWGAAECKSLGRRPARRGGRRPATAGRTSLPGGSASLLRQPWGMGRERRRWRGRQVTQQAHTACTREPREREKQESGREGTCSSGTAHLDCGGFHTTRARKRGGTPLGASDIYIAPPPLEAWGAVL